MQYFHSVKPLAISFVHVFQRRDAVVALSSSYWDRLIAALRGLVAFIAPVCVRCSVPSPAAALAGACLAVAVGKSAKCREG